MVKTAQNVLVHTGGTFSMGYDQRQALGPMYDVRLEILAMKILELRMPEEMEQDFLGRLVATREIILEVRQSGDEVLLKKKLLAMIEDMASELSLITGTDIDLQTVMSEYNIHQTIYQPYVIDSIDFTYSEHYPKLQDRVIAILEKGQTPIIILGSDTIEFIAPLLAKDAHQKGLLKTQAMIFVSSMLCFADHPKHVARMLQAALEVSSNRVAGAFAIAARDETAQCVHVHEVSKGFAKISSSVTNAFRSVESAGMVTWGEGYQPNPLYNILSENQSLFLKGERAPVSPPMVLKSDLAVITKHIRACEGEHVVIDVENWPDHSSDLVRHLCDLIRARTAQGLVTLFINPLVYDIETDTVSSRFTIEAMKDQGFLSAIKAAGASYYADITIIDAYDEVLLAVGEMAKKYILNGIQSYPSEDNKSSTSTLVLYYIPDHEMMIHAMRRAGQIADIIELYGLPGGVMPSRMVPVLELLKDQSIHVRYGYQVDQDHYATLDEYKILSLKARVRDKHRYAAAQAFLKLLPQLSAIKQISGSA